jgi:hypothetical protein
LDLAWFRKLLAALFGLTQAVGMIVIYVRRLNSGQAESFGFDHRDGAMGIASAICDLISVLVLLLRLNGESVKVV